MPADALGEEALLGHEVVAIDHSVTISLAGTVVVSPVV
jgi:hypothetical protein